MARSSDCTACRRPRRHSRSPLPILKPIAARSQLLSPRKFYQEDCLLVRCEEVLLVPGLLLLDVEDGVSNYIVESVLDGSDVVFKFS